MSKETTGESLPAAETGSPIEHPQSPDVAAYRLKAVVESAGDAIITKTLEDVTTSWNPGARRIFGYAAEEVTGKPVTVLIPEDHLDKEPVTLTRIRAGERVEHYETVRVRRDGTLVDISLTVSPFRKPDGTIIGASEIARNITARRRARAGASAAEKECLYREAREANRLKDEFLASVSDEPRRPLTAIPSGATPGRRRRPSRSRGSKGACGCIPS